MAVALAVATTLALLAGCTSSGGSAATSSSVASSSASSSAGSSSAESSSAGAAASSSAASSSAASSAGATSAPGPTRLRGTRYLSLGDSLAFGYQQGKLDQLVASGTYSPDRFPGYTTLLANRLAAALGHRITTVNLGCPGETSATFASGGCDFLNQHLALHDPYSGPQLAAAVADLRRHRGQTALVTLSLGANDLWPLLESCAIDESCLRPKLAAAAPRVAGAIGRAVRALHAADPHARVVVLLFYNPTGALLSSTDGLLSPYLASISAAVRASGGRVADAFTAFSQAGTAGTCRLTLVCGGGVDVHPSDDGYRLLADLFWNAANM